MVLQFTLECQKILEVCVLFLYHPDAREQPNSLRNSKGLWSPVKRHRGCTKVFLFHYLSWGKKSYLRTKWRLLFPKSPNSLILFMQSCGISDWILPSLEKLKRNTPCESSLPLSPGNCDSEALFECGHSCCTVNEGGTDAKVQKHLCLWNWLGSIHLVQPPLMIWCTSLASSKALYWKHATSWSYLWTLKEVGPSGRELGLFLKRVMEFQPLVFLLFFW